MEPRTIAALGPVGGYLMVFAAGCFIVVVLTHVGEAYALFPSMGWGLKRSAGHYLDLCAAILGLTLLPAGYLIRLLAERRKKLRLSCPRLVALSQRPVRNPQSNK